MGHSILWDAFFILVMVIAVTFIHLPDQVIVAIAYFVGTTSAWIYFGRPTP